MATRKESPDILRSAPATAAEETGGRASRLSFLNTESPRILLLINILLAGAYFYALLFWFPRGNPWLFWTLIAGEVFHVWQVFGMVHTVWRTESKAKFDPAFSQGVDVFITVAGEPVEIVRQTALAAKNMRYPNLRVHILNDGYVAKKENWKDIIRLAKDIGINCITRTEPGGAKAGNINNALRQTEQPFVVVFDADHIPHADFLEKTMGYFTDDKMGFVQSPQFYKNHSANYVTGGAWEQQELFFGAICKGKNRLNSTFLCGTNMAMRRTALMQAGGMFEENIAEDFLTSLFIHKHGWKSVYVPEVLAEGLAPEDFLSYYKQQFRWARGSLEVVFRHNPLFMRGLSWSQRIQYLASASFYLSGAVVLMNALLPLFYFYTGQVPFLTSTMLLATVFLPYIFLTVYILHRVSGYTVTFRAVAFSMASFPIHLSALWAVLTNKKSGFSVTSKQKMSGNFLRLAVPHLLYIAVGAVGAGLALAREGLSASLVTNLSWLSFNASIFLPFIFAASPLAAAENEENLQNPEAITVTAS